MRIRVLIVLLIMILSVLGTTETLSYAAPKTKTLKIKLPSGGTTTVKGTKQQIFKTLTKTEDNLENLEEQLEVLEQIDKCGSIACKKLENEIKDSEKIIDVITKSLYSKAADASMLSPITPAEFKYFANQVRDEIQQVQDDINDVQLGKSKELNKYLVTFENSYLYKVGWSQEFLIQAIKMSLADDLRFFNKILAGFEWLIVNKNPDGITEINISKRITIQEKIIAQEENQLQNAKKN